MGACSLSRKSKHDRLGSASTLVDYLEALREIGVTTSDSYLTDGHTTYYGAAGHQISTGPPHEVFPIAPSSNKPALLEALKQHEAQTISYVEMSKALTDAGIEKWTFDTHAQTITYYDHADHPTPPQPSTPAPSHADPPTRRTPIQHAVPRSAARHPRSGRTPEVEPINSARPSPLIGGPTANTAPTDGLDLRGIEPNHEQPATSQPPASKPASPEDPPVRRTASRHSPAAGTGHPAHQRRPPNPARPPVSRRCRPD